MRSDVFYSPLTFSFFQFLLTLTLESTNGSQSIVWKHCYGQSSPCSITKKYSATNLNAFFLSFHPTALNFLLPPNMHIPSVAVNQSPAQGELLPNMLGGLCSLHLKKLIRLRLLFTGSDLHLKKKKKKTKWSNNYFPWTVYYFPWFIKILSVGKGHLSFMYGICVCFVEKGVALKT